MTMEVPAAEVVAEVAVDAGAIATVQGSDTAPSSKWPDPIPEEWKAARAAAAEEWFQKASHQAHR